MKQLLSVLFIGPLLAGCLMAQNNDLLLQDLRVDVVYLSSDCLQGRETGTQGELLAAQYIATRFQELGLTPKGDNGTFFQEFSAVVKSNPHAQTGETRTARNVIGYINNKAQQTVVIGAHYDHLGHGVFGHFDPVSLPSTTERMTMPAGWRACSASPRPSGRKGRRKTTT